MISSNARMVRKLGVAKTVASNSTWPATVRRIDNHLEEENVEGEDQARLEKISVETVRDGCDHAQRAENCLRLREKPLVRLGGGRPREEMRSAISTNKPEKNSTLWSVNVQETEPQHATLFTVQSRICARCDNSFDCSVELLVDSGSKSDFMSMETAKRAQLSLYKLTNPGHVVTSRGVQVEVQYYTRTHVRLGEFVFRHHFKVLGFLPDVVLALPWLRRCNPTVK